MVFDFHRSCLQSAITVHWRKPTIFGDAKIVYYLLKVSLTEHVQNILRLHLYAYYTRPLTRHKAQVLTLRTSQVTLVPVTNTSVSNQPPPPPPLPRRPHQISKLEASFSGHWHYWDIHTANKLSVVTQLFSEKHCVTIYRTTASTSRPAALGFPPVLAENLPYQSTNTRSDLKNHFLPFFRRWMMKWKKSWRTTVVTSSSQAVSLVNSILFISR